MEELLRSSETILAATPERPLLNAKWLELPYPAFYFSAVLTPLHLMTPEEKAALIERLKEDAALEEHFTGVLGNKNSFFIAKPARKREAGLRNRAKITV